ncbi:MAG: glutamine-hydrolyzing GMP synthase [Bacillus subtilis]|nr:glutamine-hydrolyzing GMP synthase [Bacillus subtilis]
MTPVKIIVIDYGSQYNHLIARRVRELGVYSELWANEDAYAQISKDSTVGGIILSGGPRSVYEPDAPGIDVRIFDLGIPILGICYGMQLIAHAMGEPIAKADTREYGRKTIHRADRESLLFDNTPDSFGVFMSHGDQVQSLGQLWRIDASSSTCPIAAMRHHVMPWYGIQFHPEVVHTEYGNTILDNFITKICKIEKTWKMQSVIDRETHRIQQEVTDKRVLLGLSGGVDSSVAALLLHKAIGANLTCMFIDHGMLRKDEASQVMTSLADHFQLNVVKIDAKQRFLKALEGIVDPEQKRKIIGKEFIAVFSEEAKKLGQFDYLAQGTLYTDIIESGTKSAHTIKSHHNVGGLPKDLPFRLVEPLKTLFKDEVRRLGEELGMPHALVWRQPFPGPGLAIRIIGAIDEKKLAIVQDSDFILREEFKKAGLDATVWQYFTVLTNVQTVGVMGDGRTYDKTIAIRAVTSVDGMTAEWARIPYDVLEIVSRRIVNEINGVNRVVYDITSKPPATIEWE